MKKPIGTLLMTASLLIPCAHLRADSDTNRSTDREAAESASTKQAEEQHAMIAYRKAAEKYGPNSVQAKNAWDKVVQEYNEHGDTPPDLTATK
jgi:hypothetical protein